MAIGTRQGILPMALVRSAPSWPQISGYDVAKAATHWTAGNMTWPIFELHPSAKLTAKHNMTVKNKPPIKPKCPSHLVERDKLRKLPDIHQKMTTDILQITIDESLLQIESARDDILRILQRELMRLLKRQLILEQRLLVIRKHNHQRHIEYILQPLRERERNRMSQMQRVARRSASGVQEEGFAVLVLVQDAVEVPMRKEQASSEPAVRLVAGQALEALEELVVDQLGCPFPSWSVCWMYHYISNVLCDRGIVEG